MELKSQKLLWIFTRSWRFQTWTWLERNEDVFKCTLMHQQLPLDFHCNWILTNQIFRSFFLMQGNRERILVCSNHTHTLQMWYLKPIMFQYANAHPILAVYYEKQVRCEVLRACSWSYLFFPDEDESDISPVLLSGDCFFFYPIFLHNALFTEVDRLQLVQNYTPVKQPDYTPVKQPTKHHYTLLPISFFNWFQRYFPYLFISFLVMWSPGYISEYITVL